MIQRVVRFHAGSSATLTVRIGTSFISHEQARQNLQRELGNRAFDAVRAAGAKVWNETLGIVRIKGGTQTQQRTFYSCLYRANLFPRMFRILTPGQDWTVHLWWWKFASPVRDGETVTVRGSRMNLPGPPVIRISSFTDHWLKIQSDT